MKSVIKLIVFGAIPLLLVACGASSTSDDSGGNNNRNCNQIESPAEREACKDAYLFLPSSQTVKTLLPKNSA